MAALRVPGGQRESRRVRGGGETVVQTHITHHTSISGRTYPTHMFVCHARERATVEAVVCFLDCTLWSLPVLNTDAQSVHSGAPASR